MSRNARIEVEALIDTGCFLMTVVSVVWPPATSLELANLGHTSRGHNATSILCWHKHNSILKSTETNVNSVLIQPENALTELRAMIGSDNRTKFGRQPFAKCNHPQKPRMTWIDKIDSFRAT